MYVIGIKVNIDTRNMENSGEIIKTLARKWMMQWHEASLQGALSSYKSNLPNIEKIDDVPVDVYWILKRDSLNVVIESSDIHWYDDDEERGIELCSKVFKIEHELNETTLACAIIKARSWIRELTYHPLTGFKKVKGRQEEILVFSSPNIKQKDDLCCVCHEITSSTTKCKHSLCYRCCGKIVKAYDEKVDIETKHCPLCRQIIM